MEFAQELGGLTIPLRGGLPVGAAPSTLRRSCGQTKKKKSEERELEEEEVQRETDLVSLQSPAGGHIPEAYSCCLQENTLCPALY